MTLIQKIKDKYGPKLKEEIKKLDTNWEYTKEQREEIRNFLRTMPEKFGGKK